MVGAKPVQARLERSARVRGRPVLRPLALGVLPAPRVEHVAELGRDLDRVAIRTREGASDELLVRALAVGVTGVEEGDPELDRAPDQDVRIVGLAPPIRAERPRAERDL